MDNEFSSLGFDPLPKIMIPPLMAVAYVPAGGFMRYGPRCGRHCFGGFNVTHEYKPADPHALVYSLSLIVKLSVSTVKI